MGGHVSRNDFEWTFTDQPHISRREIMLKKYPEIKKLMVTNPWFKYQMTSLVVFQCVMLFFVKDLPWWLLFLLTYVVSGTVNQALLLGQHELTHNAAFGYSKPLLNKLFSIFANLPIGVPMAISFKKYHIDHHKFLAVDGVDVDLPTEFEAKMFTNRATKLIWVILQGFFYGIRPLVIRPLPVQTLEVLNFVVQLIFDVLVIMLFGSKAFIYLLCGSFLGSGLHPTAGHFISEHYMFKKGFETYSYYGLMNLIGFNVGYHNEHHDFPNVPGALLPKIREIAPEYYENLPTHNSMVKVIVDFINDPAIGPYARMKRKEHVKRMANSSAKRG